MRRANPNRRRAEHAHRRQQDDAPDVDGRTGIVQRVYVGGVSRHVTNTCGGGVTCMCRMYGT